MRTPPSSLQLRAQLQDMVGKDLLGPAGGPEEIIAERNVRTLPAELQTDHREDRALLYRRAGQRRHAGTNRTRLIAAIPNPALQAQVADLLQVWQTGHPEINAAGIALAQLTAAHAENQQRAAQALELVWTGPRRQHLPLRRTDQTLLQLIQEAKEPLLSVSFAVYKAKAKTSEIAPAFTAGPKKNAPSPPTADTAPSTPKPRSPTGKHCSSPART